MSRPPTAQSAARPDTAQSRSGTTRPRTSASGTDDSNRWVIAVIEGRGVGNEVGISAYDTVTSKITLTQFSDTPSFSRTLHTLSIHPPRSILVPDTALPTPDQPSRRYSATGGGRASEPTQLVRHILEKHDGTEVVPVARKYWSDAAGKDFVEQLVVDDDEKSAVLVAASAKFLALCAASALFKYLESSAYLIFSPASLRISWNALEGTLFIDPDTAKMLELVSNRANPKSSLSLFGILNKTHTPMSARFLRATLLQPSILESQLKSRLDCVEELISDDEKFSQIKTSLQPMAKIDLDKLISSVTDLTTLDLPCRAELMPSLATLIQLTQQGNKQTDPKRAERNINLIISLRVAVRSLVAVCDAVEDSQSSLLRKIHSVLSDERLLSIEECIAETLEDDPASKKSKKGLAARNAKIYAVRGDTNHLLDVARATYAENVSDILELVKNYQDELSCPSLNTVFQETAVVLTCATDDFPTGDEASILVNIAKKGANQMTFTTMELKKRTARMLDTLAEIYLLSDQTIQALLDEIRRYIAVLYKSSEAVAMLDLFWSLAYVAGSRGYVRPEFTGTLAIKGAKHPILDAARQSTVNLVPNDFYSSTTSSFQIIQGPNMSGKTTYLTTVALIVVQALVGGFVPAEYASVPLYSSILSRLSNEDDLAGSLSTFAVEMRVVSSILSLVSENSLVLIDELGRGTAPSEGIAIAHAIAEALIQSKATVFFATHLRDLSLTLAGFSSVQSMHLSVQVHGSRPMSFQYKVFEGVSEEQNYGLSLAKLADLPTDLMGVARDVSSRLSTMEREGKAASRSDRVTRARKVLLSGKEQLMNALKSDLDEDSFRDYLRRAQEAMAAQLRGHST